MSSTIPSLSVPFAAALFVATAAYAIRKLFWASPERDRPPRVPYSVPWLGSALAIGKDPDAFLTSAIQEHGPVFRVKTLGTEMVWVTSPGLINAIYRNPEAFPFSPVRLEILNTIFGVPKTLLTYHLSDDIFGAHTRLLAPKSINDLLRTYTSYAFDAISEQLDSLENCKDTRPLQSVIFMSSYISASHAVFGAAFPAVSIFQSLQDFDNAFPLIAAGFPSMFIRKAQKGWEKTVDTITQYLEEDHEDASGLIHHVNEVLEREGWSPRERAHLVGTDFWALHANTMWVSYWVIVLCHQQGCLESLIDEIDKSRNAWVAAHGTPASDRQTLKAWAQYSSSTVPLLVSTIQEVFRFCSFTMSVRVVSGQREIGGYIVNAGERIICATRSVHMDEEIHENPEIFNPRRYLDGTKIPSKGGRPIHNHSMAFGGGVSICPGRRFALSELRVFLCLILSLVSIELETPDKPIEVDTARLGASILHSKGDLRCSLRRRDL